MSKELVIEVTEVVVADLEEKAKAAGLTVEKYIETLLIQETQAASSNPHILMYIRMHPPEPSA